MPPDTDDVSLSSDSDDNDDQREMAEHKEIIENKSHKGNAAGNGTSASANSKDPLRPRRKKARRACHACQRAHLTCGDERPCQRCIKRGLQDSCHDGVRKKAKYLHDAPNDALMPGVGDHFSNVNETRQPTANRSNNGTGPVQQPGLQPPPYFTPSQSVPESSYGIYPSTSQGRIQSQLQDYTSSPTSPNIPSTLGQQAVPMNGYDEQLVQAAQFSQAPQHMFAGAMADPNDPAMFNLDLQSLDFGNHYGALEFGMLGHMSSSAIDTSSADNTASLSQTGTGFAGSTPLSSAYDHSPGSASYGFGKDPGMGEWSGDRSRQGSTGNPYPNSGNDMTARRHPSMAYGYTIGAGSNQYPNSSPSSPQNMLPGFEGGSSMNATYYQGNATGSQQQQASRQAHQGQMSGPQAPGNPPVGYKGLGGGAARARDPSFIYESVKQPYSYTTGFHSLTAFLQRHFSPQKTLRIAKSLASIRPSFISCTKNLTHDDLIFMEQCFQRTLWEYEDFISACGTPTLVCRRTGEVAAVGKEFSILTGWSKDVLLGRSANLNVNTGGSSNGSSGAASSRGSLNNRVLDNVDDEMRGKPRAQPVFLAELLDDDSVIEFYEDFAKLAFGDSRGSVTKQCKLLKYKTQTERPEAREGAQGIELQDGAEPKPGARMRTGPTQKHRGAAHVKAIQKGVAGAEGSISSLESQDGKVECRYCWTVKRDVFDIPMLIVMNASSPCLSSSLSV
ncbi:MAG: hypothetical protein M1825_004406 [Sarcosagium campestre]|nr:MAG: hypothetical protein M1825_004406 [Sarcosagium campestre]